MTESSSPSLKAASKPGMSIGKLPIACLAVEFGTLGATSGHAISIQSAMAKVLHGSPVHFLLTFRSRHRNANRNGTDDASARNDDNASFSFLLCVIETRKRLKRLADNPSSLNLDAITASVSWFLLSSSNLPTVAGRKLETRKPSCCKQRQAPSALQRPACQ